MSKEDPTERKKTPEQALTSFLEIIDDPRNMESEELDAMLNEAGFDFRAFQERLSKDISTTKNKSRLAKAGEARAKFLSKVRGEFNLTAMSLEEKRAEIQRRLSLLGPEAALVYNRNYNGVDEEEDVDETLEALMELDIRQEVDGSES